MYHRVKHTAQVYSMSCGSWRSSQLRLRRRHVCSQKWERNNKMSRNAVTSIGISAGSALAR